jgi:voltage-gated potassium channel
MDIRSDPPANPPHLTFKRRRRILSFVLYEAFYGPLIFLRVAYRQLAILAAMFIAGGAIFAYYDGLSPIPALLASVSTITTIGLYTPNGGNFGTINHTEALLLIIMIIVSVGSAASLLQTTVGAFMSGDLTKEKIEEKLIEHQKNHVIVFGYGDLGRNVVEELQQQSLDCVVVTTDAELYSNLIKNKTPAVLEHQAKPIEALERAGVRRAGMLIVAHQRDADNMMITLSARRLRPDLRVVMVVHDPDLIDAAKSAGADMVISSSQTVSHLLALAAASKDLVGVVVSPELGEKQIVRFKVSKSSKLMGKGLHEVSGLTTVIQVLRAGAVIPSLFDPTLRLAEGDTLLILGDQASVGQFEAQAGAK